MNKTEMNIKDMFSGKIGFKEVAEREGLVFVKVRQEELDKMIALFSEKEFVLVSLFCEQNAENSEFTLFYAFEKPSHDTLAVILVDIASPIVNSTFVDISSPAVNSISRTFPSASWYEREISDGFGIQFENSPDRRKLFLHEIYPKEFHPLLKSVENKKIDFRQNPLKEETIAPYQFKKIEGEGVYQIPVGPVHAGIIEPGHFRFSVIGENVYNLEIRMFYVHRGIEKLAEGKDPRDIVNIAESISGDETVANAVGFCNAIEQLSAEKIPERAIFLRTLLLEMERIYSHLGDLGGMCIDVAYPTGATPFFILREEVLRHNHALTGSRFMKGMICVGGLAKDIEKNKLDGLASFLNQLLLRLKDAIRFIYGSSSVEDRFETTGIIKQELIEHLNLTGPAARASGGLKDIRQNCAYGAYKKTGISVKTRTAGDVQSRFNVKAEEISESIRIIGKIICELPPGDVKKEISLKDGYMISMIEAPRGQNLHYVHLKNGTVQRYKIRTASFCNWQAIEHAVMDNIVPDFPLINKSLNLSYSGTDL